MLTIYTPLQLWENVCIELKARLEKHTGKDFELGIPVEDLTKAEECFGKRGDKGQLFSKNLFNHLLIYLFIQDYLIRHSVNSETKSGKSGVALCKSYGAKLALVAHFTCLPISIQGKGKE